MTTGSRQLYNNESELGAYIRDQIFEPFKENRGILEDKWEKNRLIWKGKSTKSWKSHQDKPEDWESDTEIDIANQKGTMACSLIYNMAFKKGRLPMKLETLDALGADKAEKHSNDEKIFEAQNYIDQTTFDQKVPNEFRRGFQQSAKYGETYYKMYIGDFVNKEWKQDDLGDFEEVDTINEYLGIENVTCWDIFRDLETDDLQEGRGMIHRQYISTYELRSFKGRGEDYYDKAIDSAIDLYLSGEGREADDDTKRPDRFGQLTNKNNDVEYLECWVRVPRILVKNFLKYEAKQRHGHMNYETDELNSGDEVFVLVGIVGNVVVRFMQLEFGARPFLRQVWEDDPDECMALGVCDKLERYQNVLTGSFREFEDNKKLSGNVITALKRKMIKNMPETLAPGTQLDISEDCERASDAIQPIVIPDVGDGLLSLIDLTLNLADNTSNMPREMMGQSGGSAASVTEYTQVIARSSKYLLSVVAHFDSVLEEYLEKFFEYMMADPKMKHLHGNYKVRALGFESFEARSVKMANLMQMMTMTAQSETLSNDMDTSWLITEIAKSLDIDPERARKSEEQKAQEQEQYQNSPEYQMNIARQQADIDKIHSQIKLDEMKLEIELQKLALEKLKLEKAPDTSIGGGVDEGGVLDEKAEISEDEIADAAPLADLIDLQNEDEILMEDFENNQGV